MVELPEFYRPSRVRRHGALAMFVIILLCDVIAVRSSTVIN
jgi:hypothetical protein